MAFVATPPVLTPSAAASLHSVSSSSRVASAPVLLFRPPEERAAAAKKADKKSSSSSSGTTNALQQLRQQLGEVTGRVTPTQQPARAAKAAAAAEEEEEGELSIKELLQQYGVIALLFHFSVWFTCLASVYTLLTFGIDVDALLPDWLLGSDDGEAGAAAAGVAGRVAATLAVVEGIGPARLALTVAATPKVSAQAREYQAVRDLEEWVYGFFPGGGEEK